MSEDPEYLTRQLITYIGNKRSLLGPIRDAIHQVQSRLGKTRLRCFDAFSGSGAVSRLLKSYSSALISNDLESYSAVVNRCYLSNRESVPLAEVIQHVDMLNSEVERGVGPAGFIEDLYAPRDESKIVPTDRVFYTRANARRLDAYRQLIEAAPAAFRDLLLGPLLSEASVHANTAGVFKGFYKNRRTGIGQFGGSGADALPRILGEIRLEAPVLSRFSCEVEVHQEDANVLAPKLRSLDLAYLDPPYNQHPYGSNYFMLNLIVNYQRPEHVSAVSGIPPDWNRSGYNVRSQAAMLLEQLLNSLDSRFVLISFNNEGFIPPDVMMKLLLKFGEVQVYESKYNAFRGCRNFSNRPLHTRELLFLVERR